MLLFRNGKHHATLTHLKCIATSAYEKLMSATNETGVVKLVINDVTQMGQQIWIGHVGHMGQHTLPINRLTQSNFKDNFNNVC